MVDHHLNPIVAGNIEALEQVVYLLENLTDEQYSYIPHPYIASSIGSHIRHLIDMYYAISKRDNHFQLIDYDTRRRGSEIEEDRSLAIQELRLLIDWMNQLATDHFDEPVMISSEVMLQEKLAVKIPSNLARELAFVGSHALHHFALIAVIARLQDINVDDHFGIAPATITYMRSALCAQ